MRIVKDGLCCYAVHSFEHSPYYLSTEYPMIRYNEIGSLLPVQVMEQNGEKIARFDITGNCSLMDWGEKRRIGEKEFKMILQSIANLFYDLEEHMLSLNQVCFQADQIYINSADEIHWIYLPEWHGDILDDVKQLFLWILSVADYKSKQGMDLICHVFDGVKKKEFSREFVESCLQTETEHREPQILPEFTMLEARSKVTSEEISKVRSKTASKITSKITSEATSKIRMKGILKKEDGKEKTGIREKTNTIITVVKGILAGALMIFDFCLAFSGIQFVMEEGMSYRMAIIFVVAFLVFLFSAYSLLQILPAEIPGKRVEDRVGKRTREDIDDYKKAVDFPKSSVSPRILCDDTTGKFIPMLTDQDTGEEVDLEVFPFYIGTKDGLNHLCIDSQGLSRQHAVITRTEDGEGYQLEDLGSKSGTKLNGQSLDSAYPVFLPEGSRIEFGKSRWIFHLDKR